MAHSLQPIQPHANLSSAVTDYLTGLKSPDLPAFTVTIEVDDLRRAVSQTAYLVLLEAISNVARHADARSATVSATLNNDHLKLEVIDDGIGLQEPYISGMGITSMRRRVESAGGTFMIERGRSNGTRLSASIPLRVN